MSDFHDKYELVVNEKLNLYNIKYNLCHVLYFSSNRTYNQCVIC